MIVSSLTFSQSSYANEIQSKHENLINTKEINQIDTNIESQQNYCIEKFLESEDTLNLKKETIPISVKNITDTSVTLSWDLINFKDKNYSLFLYNNETDTYDFYCHSEHNFINLDKLIPASKYQFKIAEEANDLTFDLEEISFITKPSPATLQIKNKTQNSITLEWNSINNIDDYYIYRSVNNNSYEYFTEVSADTNVFTDNNIKEGTEYSYMITTFKTIDESIVESEFSNSLNVKIPKREVLALPSDTNGKSKTYAYYTAVTVKNSPQYAVLNSGTYDGVKYNTYTDESTGIRMVDDCYCAALGSFYGTKKGQKYLVTLESGKTFKIILCDTKSDRHTDPSHKYAVKNKDVIEFYVEKSKIPSCVNGDYNVLPQFNGAIKSIEKIK